MSSADNNFGIVRPAVLRGDLVIVENDESGGDLGYLVRDPRSGETFEFGEEEWYLLQNAGERERFDALSADFEQRFGASLTREDFRSFLAMVGEWGLLARPGGAPPAARAGAPRLAGAGAPPRAAASRAPAPRAASRAAPPDDDLEDELADDDMLSWPGLGEDAAGAGRRPLAAGAGPLLLDEHDVHWAWFDSRRMLARMARMFAPLRYLVWALPVLLVLALAALFGNLDQFIDDLARATNKTTLIQHLLFSMLTVNLVSQLVRGMVCEHFGGSATPFGIRFIFHLIPRFAIDVAGLDTLSRRAQMWIHGSALLARLFLLGVGVILWQAARSGGTHLPEIGAMLATISLITFFLAANPLLRGNGYRFLTAALEMPFLRERANRALFGRGREEGGPDTEGRFALAAFALASLIFVILLLGVILAFVARWLELHYQGTGVVIFLVLLFVLGLTFRRRILDKRERIRGVREQAGQARNPGQTTRYAAAEPVDEEPGRREPTRARPRQTRRPPAGGGGRRWLVWLLLAALVPVLFLPYPYETGGPLQVLPGERHEVYPDQVRGVIQQVYYKGGEHLAKGTLLAVVSSLEEETDVLTTQAAILEQQAKVDQLLNTPRPEELALARQRLETARTQAAFTSDSAARLEKLFKSGTVSLEQYEDERRKAEVDRMTALEEEANLTKVQAGPHPQEIQAAQYELMRLKNELKFHEERLRLTQLQMPIEGRVVTRNLDHLTGKFLDMDDLFAVVENDTRLRIEIQVPEADVGEVQTGARVRLKVWTYPDRIFYGEVSEISPVAEEVTFGRVVVVTAVIDNPEGMLRSGMTGFGKVAVGNKPVIVAFTRMLVRFFLVEVWSWLP